MKPILAVNAQKHWHLKVRSCRYTQNPEPDVDSSVNPIVASIFFSILLYTHIPLYVRFCISLYRTASPHTPRYTLMRHYRNLHTFTQFYRTRYGSFPKSGDPNVDPKNYSPYYGDPQKGTHNFGKSPYAPSITIYLPP